jgi:hypothetical protein
MDAWRAEVRGLLASRIISETQVMIQTAVAVMNPAEIRRNALKSGSGWSCG